MSISSTTRKAGPFTGNGVQVAFPFAYKVFSAADVLVVQAVTATGVETAKVLTTDYTVVVNADQTNFPGGTVTMLVAPPVGTTLTLSSQVANLQPVVLTNAGGFYPAVINDALDRLTIQTQQLYEKLGRALLSAISTTSPATLPAPTATKVLAWNAAGTNLENVDMIAGQSNLATGLAASSGASLVGLIQSGTGAVARTLQDKNRELVSVRDFGAKGDSTTNDTAAIQAALTYCYSVNKDLFIPSGNYLISAQLLNKGVSMVGEGRLYSQFVLATSFPAATSILLVQPDNGAYIDFLELGRFSIQPTNGGTKYGGTAIFMNFQQTTNLSKLHMHDLYLLPGNDYSFQISNNMAVNFQGVPANSTVERCYFAEGSKLIGIGDSNMIHENIFRASGGNRTAIWLYMSDTSGVASHTVIRENNIDCPGGALYAIKGRSIKFIYNNVELSAGSGTPNGAIVDIDGSSGSIPWAEVSSNHIGIFGTATGTSAVRVNGAQGCSVDKNTILSGLTVASAILITASAGDTDIGFNEIQSTYTTPINNSGLRTMGVPLALSFVNGFTNTGGGYQTLSAYKSRTGLVTLAGVVNAPATPSGLVIATLSLGYRPSTLQRFSVATVSGGNIVGYAVEVDTSGNVVCYCVANTTRIEINATFQTLNYVSGSL